ncbi:MAG: DUF86 domain-containing protein [Chloroflexi bacterium]|nr:DUF86 domain-containing protein [Chloroflexota bacterium]
MSPRDWKIRISDILECIQRITTYTQDMTQNEFQADQKTIDAVLRNLEIIGEAARLIPEKITKQYPDIPWDEMRAMRNIVIHEYFGVNLNIIWHTTQVNLPSIVDSLKEILEKAK